LPVASGWRKWWPGPWPIRWRIEPRSRWHHDPKSKSWNRVGKRYYYIVNIRFWEISILGDCLLRAVFIDNYTSSPNFKANLFNGKSYALIFTKNALGYIISSQTHLVILVKIECPDLDHERPMVWGLNNSLTFPMCVAALWEDKQHSI
jgi:hypothetical protein